MTAESKKGGFNTSLDSLIQRVNDSMRQLNDIPRLTDDLLRAYQELLNWKNQLPPGIQASIDHALSHPNREQADEQLEKMFAGIERAKTELLLRYAQILALKKAIEGINRNPKPDQPSEDPDDAFGTALDECLRKIKE